MGNWHLRIVAFAAIGAACLVVGAADLIYVEDDGGGGSPRGLYDFDPDSGISSLRATLDSGPRFFSLARRPSDGSVIAMHPIGSVIYTLDLNTGDFTFLANTGLDTIADIAFHPTTGIMYGLGRNTSLLYRIDPATGASKLIANIAPIRRGLTFSPDCVMYGVTVLDGTLYTIDPSNGAITHIGGSGPQPRLVEDASFTPEGRMFLTDFGGTIYEIDPATGGRSVVGTTGMGSGLVALINADPIASCGPCDPCDMNCDGTVNPSDIEPFIDILFNGARPCDTCTGDTNGDGLIDAGDIEGFIACLFP